jgi:hypothetical protein
MWHGPGITPTGPIGAALQGHRHDRMALRRRPSEVSLATNNKKQNHMNAKVPLAAAVIGAVLLVQANPATAQERSFCGNRIIVDNPRYTTAAPDFKPIEYTFWVRVRNTSSRPITVTVRFNAGDFQQFNPPAQRVWQRGSAEFRLGMAAPVRRGLSEMTPAANYLPNVEVTCVNSAPGRAGGTI